MIGLVSFYRFRYGNWRQFNAALIAEMQRQWAAGCRRPWLDDCGRGPPGTTNNDDDDDDDDDDGDTPPPSDGDGGGDDTEGDGEEGDGEQPDGGDDEAGGKEGGGEEDVRRTRATTADPGARRRTEGERTGSGSGGAVGCAAGRRSSRRRRRSDGGTDCRWEGTRRSRERATR